LPHDGRWIRAPAVGRLPGPRPRSVGPIGARPRCDGSPASTARPFVSWSASRGLPIRKRQRIPGCRHREDSIGAGVPSSRLRFPGLRWPPVRFPRDRRPAGRTADWPWASPRCAGTLHARRRNPSPAIHLPGTPGLRAIPPPPPGDDLPGIPRHRARPPRPSGQGFPRRAGQ